jgi:hypothetical protein
VAEVDGEGAKAGWELRREREKAEIVQGTIKLERSERGCPMVDISQLNRISIDLSHIFHSVEGPTYSSIPITLGSVL